MRLITNRLDYEDNDFDYVGFTANGVVYKGRLIMGRGNAKSCKVANYNIDKLISDKLREGLNTFYFIKVNKILVLQTKLHWRGMTPLNMLQNMINKLNEFAKVNKDKTIGVPMPGVGLGGLDYNVVIKLVERLPDNVYVHYIKL